MRARVQLLLWAGGTCAVVGAPRVFAQNAGAHVPVLTVSGVCPTSRAIEDVLASLLPAGLSGEPVPQAGVSDRGETYVVVVGERAKTYVDGARNCAERARVAAVFIALVLAPEVPPTKASSTPNPAPSASAAPSPSRIAPQTDAPTPRVLRFDLRGALQSAPQGGLFSPGVELGVAAAAQRFGLGAECGWLSPAALNVSGAGERILLERFPCAIGPSLRLVPGAGPVEVSLDADVVLGAIVARGRGFATTYDSARFEVGARIALNAVFFVAAGPRHVGFAPVVGFEATYVPVVYDLVVMPRPVVARTPSVWAGITAGVSWSVE
jgi:hypothetical protein